MNRGEHALLSPAAVLLRRQPTGTVRGSASCPRTRPEQGWEVWVSTGAVVVAAEAAIRVPRGAWVVEAAREDVAP